MSDPLTLEQAIAMVDAWGPEYEFSRPHKIARVLRRGLEQSEQRDHDAYEEGAGRIEAMEAEVAAMQRERDAWLRRACAAIATTSRVQEETAERLATLRRENEELRRELAAKAKQLAGFDSTSRDPIEAYPLARVLDLMNAWGPAMQWGLHQMCRVLRTAFEKERRHSQIRGAMWWQQIEDDAALRFRINAAIPCARARSEGECFGPDYPYAPCCNLRVALLPGEPIDTDYLAESGEVHLFEPANPEHPGAPLKSAGCVKLVEPSIDGWRDAVFEIIHSDASMAAHIANSRGPS